MQITNIARGAALAKTLGDAPVALMRGHGNVVVGTSVKQATVYAVYADINARMQAAALALKTSIVVMNEPELFDPSEFDINRPWEHFRQKLDAEAGRNTDRTQFGLAQNQSRIRPSGRDLMVRVAFIVGDYPSEESTRREQVALSYSNSEVQVGIVRAPITPYFYGMTQCEMTLVAPTVIEAFHRAQKEGYQAAVPLGFLDLGLDGGRAAVDIPVIAPFECSLHLASLLGDRFGLVCYHENQFGNLSMLLNRYGMAHKVVGMEASGFDLPDIAANKDAMIENFLKSARKLIDEDRAEVIIPTGITQCPVTMDPKWLRDQLGVPVVEGIGAPLRLAAMFADLGMTHSRKRWYKSPTYANK